MNKKRVGAKQKYPEYGVGKVFAVRLPESVHRWAVSVGRAHFAKQIVKEYEKANKKKN